MVHGTASDRTRHLLGATALWIVAAIGARVGLQFAPADLTWRVPLALLPVPAFVLFLVALLARVRDLDELGRRVHLEALAIAFTVTTVLLMVLGHLQLAVELPAEDLSYRHVWAWMPLVYLGAFAVANRRYR
jgi:hypothetical protein